MATVNLNAQTQVYEQYCYYYFIEIKFDSELLFHQADRKASLSTTEAHCHSLPASVRPFILSFPRSTSLGTLKASQFLGFSTLAAITFEALHLPRCCQKQGTSAHSSRTQFAHHLQVEPLPCHAGCLQTRGSLTPCSSTLV